MPAYGAQDACFLCRHVGREHASKINRILHEVRQLQMLINEKELMAVACLSSRSESGTPWWAALAQPGLDWWTCTPLKQLRLPASSGTQARDPSQTLQQSAGCEEWAPVLLTPRHDQRMLPLARRVLSRLDLHEALCSHQQRSMAPNGISLNTSGEHARTYRHHDVGGSKKHTVA